MTFKLRWYQEEAINSIYHYFLSKNGNPVIGLPTGSGKTAIPNVFIQRVIKEWPNQKFMVVSHIKELLEQAYVNMMKVWPEAPVGIYSAGIGRKDTAHPIIFAGIQSAVKNAMQFGHRDLIFIDEVHMVNQDENSMYQNFLAVMKLINPNIKFIGLSATLFRMGQGHITDNGLFTDVIYDMTNMEGFNKLIEQGFLLPLVPLRTRTQLDTSDVGISKGDFVLSQLEKKVDVNEVTYAALREACEYGKDRKSWLVFSSGIDHSNHISEMLQSFGIDCVSVHSKQTKEFNDKAIKSFKNGDIKVLSSYSKLSTGFDHPAIDLIIDLRPTMSVPLHVQKYGRGTRPVYADGFDLNTIEGRLASIKASPKQNCLALDYGKNTQRLGFINDPVLPRRKGEGGGETPVKICEFCGVFNHIKNKTCTHCETEFSFEIKITKTAGFHELIKSDLPIIETFDVDRVIYNKHQKSEASTPCLKITYFTGIRSFNEWLFPQSMKGLGRHTFHTWWRARSNVPPPSTVEEALGYCQHLKKPKNVKVWVNKDRPEIMGVEF